MFDSNYSGADFRNRMFPMFRIILFLLLLYLLLHLRSLSAKSRRLRERAVNMCDCARLGAMLVLLANGKRGLSRRLRKKLPRERNRYVVSFLEIVTTSQKIMAERERCDFHRFRLLPLNCNLNAVVLASICSRSGLYWFVLVPSNSMHWWLTKLLKTTF
jgi:hypothetical protein